MGGLAYSPSSKHKVLACSPNSSSKRSKNWGGGSFIGILGTYDERKRGSGGTFFIETDSLDTRNSIVIGEYVIIGHGTEIITTSHNIDSPEWERKDYGLVIEDYVWLPTKVLVLLSCRRIGRGAVASSGSVVVHNVKPMQVVGGNPAK